MSKAQRNNDKKCQNSQSRSKNLRGRQGRKDNSSKRVNFDNARESKVDQDINREIKSGLSNDFAWYNRNPELIKAAASLPFSQVTGQLMQGGPGVPGIMVFSYDPTIGQDPIIINQAFNDKYSFQVHANSRNYAYNSPDLGMLITAGCSVFEFLQIGIRIYGVIKYYDQRNAYLPDHLIRALGFDPGDIRENLSNMWFDLNDMINQTKQIWIPDDLPIVNRRNFLNSTIFSDAPGPQAQLYAFKPVGFWQYDETSLTTGGSLNYIKLPSNCTWAQYVNYFNSLMLPLLNSEDRGIMFGDILNAYGPGRILALNPITSDYTVIPQYSPEMQMQIENLTISGLAGPSKIIQFNNRIVPYYSTTVDSSSSLPINMTNKALINFHIPEQPSIEQITIATRLTAIGVVGGTAYTITKGVPSISSGEYALMPASFATEVVRQCEIWTLNPLNTPASGQAEVMSDTIAKISLFSNMYNVLTGATLNYTIQTADLTANEFSFVSSKLSAVVAEKYIDSIISAFDWHPTIYLTKGSYTISGNNPSIGGAEVLGAICDVDNTFVISPDVMSKLHNAATYSEWGVPSAI